MSSAATQQQFRPVLQFYLDPKAKARGVKFSPPRDLDAGFDLAVSEDCRVPAGASALLPTALHLAIPAGWVGLVRDRSSVAKRGGVTAAGVIDAAYRGGVKVLLYNHSAEEMIFSVGDRIAQCVIVPHLSGAACSEVSSEAELGITERGVGGFGSTGR